MPGDAVASKRAGMITLSLIVLFSIKPAADLLWAESFFTIAGRPISLLHVMGVLVFVYFGRYLFTDIRHSAPYAGLFKLFIAWNVVSIVFTSFYAEISLIQIVDLLLRIVDSYIVYNVAFFAARGNVEHDQYRIIKAVSIGTFVALVINLLAIKMGYGGIKLSSNMTLREHGLYHDPGTLSNIALYNLIFTSFLYHLLPKKKPVWLIYGAITSVLSLYLIYLGLSRAVMVQLVVFGLIYVGIFKKGLGRFATLSFMAVVIVAGALLGLNYGRYTQRFQSEIMVFENPQELEHAKQDKDVNFGIYERLGSNRGQLIAYALDDFLKRPPAQQAIGDITVSPSHSDYIDILSRNGFVGLLIYLVFLFMIWRKTLMLIVTGTKQQGWAMDVLAFTLFNLYILYSVPFRPLSYTTLSWFMWAVIGYSFGRRYWIAQSVKSPKSSGIRSQRPSLSTGKPDLNAMNRTRGAGISSHARRR